MIDALLSLFTGRKENQIGGMKVRFYIDAAVIGSHGKIKVSNKRLGLVEKDVNFVFEGLTSPPDLTPALMEYIWTEAMAQGYVPHCLVGCLQENRSNMQAEAAALQAPVEARPYVQDVPAVPALATANARPFDDITIPAFMRRSDTVLKTAGYDAAAVEQTQQH